MIQCAKTATAASCTGREAAGGLFKVREHLFHDPETSGSEDNGRVQTVSSNTEKVGDTTTHKFF